MDAGKVRIFLNFSEDKTRDRWGEGELAQSDVWLVDAEAPLPASRKPVVVVRVVDNDTKVDDEQGRARPVLQRPLQLEHFQQMLLQVEAGQWQAISTRQATVPPANGAAASTAEREHGSWDVDTVPSALMDLGAEAVRPASAPASSASLAQPEGLNGKRVMGSESAPVAKSPSVDLEISFIETAPVSMEPAVPVPVKTAPPPRPAVGPNKSGHPTVLPNGYRFRLKRWPTAINLARHIYLPRLASFLVTRHLSVAELSRLSHVSVQECESFLSIMDSLGILDLKEMSSADAAVDAVARNSEFGDSQSPAPVAASNAVHSEAAHGTHAKHRSTSPSVAGTGRSGSMLGLVGRLRSRLGLS